MRNAWHSHYALALVFKVVCGGFGIALLTPLQGVMFMEFYGSFLLYISSQ
ncbi:DUF3265 domain-containing protein [Vibrio parahaemolyticus]|nr:DUF3265 domain-containing protein [Vibrio parahaemolyticus]